MGCGAQCCSLKKQMTGEGSGNRVNLGLEAPVVAAGAAEAGLHLVRNAHAARPPHHLQSRQCWVLLTSALCGAWRLLGVWDDSTWFSAG